MTHTTSPNNGDAERAETMIQCDTDHLVALALSGSLPDAQAAEVLRAAFSCSSPAADVAAWQRLVTKLGELFDFDTSWTPDQIYELACAARANFAWVAGQLSRRFTVEQVQAMIALDRAQSAARRSPVADAAGGLPVLPDVLPRFVRAGVIGYTAEQVRQAQREAREQGFDEGWKAARRAPRPPGPAQLARTSAPEAAPVGMVNAIEALLRDAENQNCYGGSEDSSGALHPGYVDWDTLRSKVRSTLAAPTSASAQPPEGVEHASDKENSDE